MKVMGMHPRTADINKIQQAASKKSRADTLAWLARTFPKAFDTEVKIQPLKIGIINDIFAHLATLNQLPFSKSKLREALVMFTRRMDYLASLKTKNMRIDLEGNPVAEVTAEEAQKAAAKIKKQIEKTIQQRRRESESSSPPRAPTATGTKIQAMIKLKKRPPRSFDPNAVARLKEKLGLKKEEVEEVGPV